MQVNPFTFGYILFLLVATIYRIYRRSVTKSSGSKKKGVVYAKPICGIQVTFYTLIVLGCIIEYFFIERRINLLVSVFGLSLYLFGIFGREYVIKALGEYWSVDIEIKEDHRIIKDGPYRYMRHPHLALLQLELTGLALIPNSYYSLLTVWLIYFPLTLYRIHLEEKALIGRFGKEYLDYKKEVYALLPIKKVKE